MRPAPLALALLAPALLAAAPEQYDVGADTVVDRWTKLEWQRGTAPAPLSLPGARAWCEALSLAGRDDWRLPTAKELLTLVDVRRRDPAIDLTIFPNSAGAMFRSSTPMVAYPGSYLLVDFTLGFAVRNWLDDSLHRVRCVRDR